MKNNHSPYVSRQRNVHLLALTTLIAGLANTTLGASGGQLNGERVGVSSSAPAPALIVRDRAAEIPIGFEENSGQTDAQVRFVSRVGEYTLFLTPSEAVLSMCCKDTQRGAQGGAVVRVRFLGANSNSALVGVGRLPTRTNYFRGGQRSAYLTAIGTYQKVRYRELYPGVDLVFYGHQRELEFDFVISPGSDPEVIRLGIEGAGKTEIDKSGNLILSTADGELTMRAPVIYQRFAGLRREISGSFEMKKDSQVGFRVATYDRSKPLVIDPVLVYSTYLGGSATDDPAGSAVDAAGRVYLAGITASLNFPLEDPEQGVLSGIIDFFVSVLSADGSSLIYSTYIGGSNEDQGLTIDVDSMGNAYVAGATISDDLPVLNPYQASRSGSIDGYLAKLDPNGVLIYSTYFGGSGAEQINAVAVDDAGNAYLGGFTDSTDLPTVNPIQGSLAGGRDAFIAKLDTVGNTLIFSTYLGGSGGDDIDLGALSTDALGNVYATGPTSSTDFPTMNAAQPTNAGGSSDIWIAALTPSGALIYSTYWGGSGRDLSKGIAADAAGNVYVVGQTNDASFPTVNPIQGFAGQVDVIVILLDPNGVVLAATPLGASNIEDGTAVAVDASQNAYVGGITFSDDFPTLDPIQGQGCTPAASQLAFISKLNLFPSGGGLLFSTCLGDTTGAELLRSISVDSAGGIYAVGFTDSTNFPTVNAFQQTNAGDADGFIAKIECCCGDGTLDPSEECDDGNTDELDGCLSDCTVAEQQSARQQRCINGLNKSFAKVAGVQSRENFTCIRDASRGKLSGLIEDCLTEDRRGRVAKVQKVTVLDAARKCTSPASFGPNDAAVANEAAVDKEIDLLHDIFGPSLDGGVIVEQAVNRDSARCQQAVARTTSRCQNTLLREFNRCKRIGLRAGTIVSRPTLEECLGADPSDRVLRSCDASLGKIRRDIDRRCVSRGVGLSDAFPGCATNDPATLAGCLETSVACRACKALNAVDNLARDCDEFDDGVVNGSCS